jgi:hypothetical protein
MRFDCAAFESDKPGNRPDGGGIRLSMTQTRGDPMPRMRLLLESDPSIPLETRRAISRGDDDARMRLVDLGLNECEAAELLDERPQQEWLCV